MLILPAVVYTKGLPYRVPQVSVSRTGTRAIAAIGYGDGYWQADVETGPLLRQQIRTMRAFIDAAKNAMESVDFSPAFLGVPMAYEATPNHAALLDNGNLVSVTNGYQVTINSVTNGLTIGPGDMFGLQSGDYRSLHTVKAGGGAVAAGGAITLTLNNPVPSYITAGAVARFKGFGLNMRMMPGTEKLGEEYVPSASFTLVEVSK